MNDLTGHRYGKLTVIERRGSKRTYAAWLCKCDCGNEVVVSSGNLRSGNTKSCGCSRGLLLGVASFNNLIGRMKYAAKARGYVWRLTREQVAHLTKQQCHYCGVVPNQVEQHRGVKGNYIYNGIDRLDNTKGYVIDNVVPCCGVCNRAKNDMTVREFRTWLVRVCGHFMRESVV